MLSNSCAEFVENRAGQAIIRRVTGLKEDDKEQRGEDQKCSLTPRPEFVAAIDKFIEKDQGPDLAALYKPSEEKMQQFEAILRRFSAMLHQRKEFAKLGVEIRDAKDFDLLYVLSIAKLINDKRQGEKNTRLCKRFMAKCFKVVYRHKDALANMINLVPTDTYGCLISGGFAIILAAVESHESLREDIQAALASIPIKLRRIRKLSEIHVQSPELHESADGVFISIFEVLERIINKLSTHFTFKFKSNFNNHGSSVKDAIESLDSSIADFQKEVDVCMQIRIGRMDEKLGYIDETLKRLPVLLQNITAEALSQSHKKQSEEVQGGSINKLETVIYNVLYRFLGASPAFNPVDGTVNKGDAMEQIRISKLRAIESRATLSLEQQNKQMVDSWLEGLGEFTADSHDQITQCLSRISDLDGKEQDRALWIMNSKVFQAWLSGGNSSSRLLAIWRETPAEDLVDCLSFTTAMLATSLARIPEFIVLSFFCRLRRNKSLNDEDSGELGILKSLNGQLLAILCNRQLTVDLGPLIGSKKRARKSREGPERAFALFESLLKLLFEDRNDNQDVVLILLDSFSGISGDKQRGDRLVEKIVQASLEMPSLCIRVLVTDCLPNSSIRKLASHQLYVPDHVDGGIHGINVRFLEQRASLRVQQFQKQRERSIRPSSSEDDSDQTSDSDVDNECLG
ncbi:hypothetical protein B7494_g3358 [Chlorociboria aeruginascens]|nr:hypothetical protein B7494_g3358 [Chlorociboria aeruginascens]